MGGGGQFTPSAERHEKELMCRNLAIDVGRHCSYQRIFTD